LTHKPRRAIIDSLLRAQARHRLPPSRSRHVAVAAFTKTDAL